MIVDVREESAASLGAYASISIAFEVREVLDVEVEQGGLAGIRLRKRTLDRSYVKDYDALDGGPTRWAQRFELSNWCLLAAYVGTDRVGGAAIVFGPSELGVSQPRADLAAVVWDVRVSSAHRGRGVGSALLAAATARVTARGCRQLEVETQNVNVGACTFYARHGFELGAIDRLAYPSLPDEVQLVWYKALVLPPG
jgi:ribosomal protein S18 acetylase RimI-like enzyme